MAFSAAVIVVLAIVVGLSNFEIVKWLLGADKTIVAIGGGVAATFAVVWVVEHYLQYRERKKESERIEAERAAEMRKLTTEDGSPGHERGSTSINRDSSMANDDWDDSDYD